MEEEKQWVKAVTVRLFQQLLNLGRGFEKEEQVNEALKASAGLAKCLWDQVESLYKEEEEDA